jgi:fermentation-respiration switch protein FrsA (DUF1100 family)
MGGAVAIQIAGIDEYKPFISGLIIENTFTSVYDVAVHFFSKKIIGLILSPFLKFILHNYWNSESKITKVSSRVLFIKGVEDQLIPVSQMRTL